MYVFTYVAQAHAQNTPLEWFWSTPYSRAEAVERDLLVVYPVIDIGDMTSFGHGVLILLNLARFGTVRLDYV